MIITNEHMEKAEREKLGGLALTRIIRGACSDTIYSLEHFYAQAPFYAQPVGLSMSERSSELN